MNTTTDDTPTPSQTILIFTIVGLIVVSALGLICSGTTIVVIVASKPLHSPCFMLIAGGGIGSFMVAAHYVTRGIDKIGLQVGVFGFERTGLQCLLLCGTLGIWGIAFHSQLACLVAMDRLISVTAPIKYRQLGKRYAMVVLVTCAAVTTFQEIIGFATAPLYVRLLCTEFMDALHPHFIKSYAEINLFYCVVNVLAYGGMMICFRFRGSFSGGSSTFQDMFAKQQLAIMPTVKLMVALYLVTGVLAEILINIGLQLPLGDPAFILLTTGTILKDASSLVEGFSLFQTDIGFLVDAFDGSGTVVLMSQKARLDRGGKPKSESGFFIRLRRSLKRGTHSEMASMQKNQQYCECKPPINFSIEFPNHKVIMPNSHDYQFEAFIYTCVILLNYLFLTTVLMVKLICFAPARVTTGDERVSFDMQVLKQFREREKRKKGDFEIESRRRVKERMVNYLKSMQHIAAYMPNMADDRQRQVRALTGSSPIRRTISAGDYSVIEDEQQEVRRTGRSASTISFDDNQNKSHKVDQIHSGWRRRAEIEDLDVAPIWMTKVELKEFEGKLNRRYTHAGDLGSFLIDVDEPEFEHYV